MGGKKISGSRRRYFSGFYRVLAASLLLSSFFFFPSLTKAAPMYRDATFYGVNAENRGAVDQSSPNLEQWFQEISAMGAAQVRINFSWDDIQPDNGPYDWSGMDNMVLMARKYGLKVVAVMVGAPQWAVDASVISSDPENYREYPPWDNGTGQFAPQWFAGFVGAAVKRYKPHGELSAEKGWSASDSWGVTDWQIGNESNTKPSLPGIGWGGTVAQYAALLKSSYPVVHAECGAYPACNVISAGLADRTEAADLPGQWPYLWDAVTRFYESLDNKQSAGYFDTLAAATYQWYMFTKNGSYPDATRSYEFPDPWWYRDRLEGVINVMATYGDSAKKLWLAETGYIGYDGCVNDAPAGLGCLSEEGQADALNMVYQVSAGYPQVEKVFWWQAYDTDYTGNLGLIKEDLTPKMAFETYSAIVAGILPPANLSLKRWGGSFQVGWTAPPGSQGVTGYEVERALSAGGPWTLVATTTGTEIIDAALDPDILYYYRVRAYDSQGNPSIYSEPVSARSLALFSVLKEESTPYLKWTGWGWRTSTGSSYSGGATKYTKTKGNALEVPFRGTTISWMASRAYNRGKADVYIDGAYQATVDLYQSSVAYRQAVFSKTGLTDTAHTLKIVATGTKRPEATDVYIDVDALGIYGYSPGVNLEQTTTLAYWRGGWTTYSASFLSGGSTKSSATASSSVDLTFKGTSIAWIGSKAFNRGIAAVYIDGVFQANIDQYAPSVSYQQVIYARSGLSNATHKLRIVVTGNKNAASSGFYVEVDAFVTGIPAEVSAGL